MATFLQALPPLVASSLLVMSASSCPMTTPAVVDRIEEEEWLVLDVPPHPSLNVPLRLAPSIEEGDAVLVTIGEAPDGAWTIEGRDKRGLVLGDADGSFHWPESLAPALADGDRVLFTVVADPEETEHRRTD
jgi:hypothetical protein